ncbi:hypothetical protein ACFL6Y_01740 [Elusimicrobiota bacterium]
MYLYRVAQMLGKKGIDYAIAGGFAVALHGAVRGTVDVDIVVRLSEKNFLKAAKALESMGLKSRIPVEASEVFNFRREYIEKRNLVAWTFVNPDNPVEIVDLILTHDLGKMKIKKIRSGGLLLPVVAIKDLIAMKRASGRPQDVEDIKALEALK